MIMTTLQQAGKCAERIRSIPDELRAREWHDRVVLIIQSEYASMDATIDKMRRVLNQSLLALDQLMGDTDLADDDSLEMKTCQAILQVLHEGPLSETDKAWIDGAWERYKMAALK